MYMYIYVSIEADTHIPSPRARTVLFILQPNRKGIIYFDISLNRNRLIFMYIPMYVCMYVCMYIDILIY